MTIRRHLITLSLHRVNFDRLVIVYLALSAFYPVLNPPAFPHPWANAAQHGALGLAVWFLVPILRCSRLFLLRLIGDIYLPLLFPLFYGEMLHLGLIYFDFDQSLDPVLIQFEQQIFGMQPSIVWAQAWPWPWFHEIMEFAYFSYYFLDIAFLVLVFRSRELSANRQWAAVHNFVRDLSATMLICYTMYTLFPAWGPKYFRLGYIPVDGWIFTDLMHYIHDHGALLGAAFPSSHVAASMIPWWHTWRHFPRHRWWMTTIFVLLCMSTVYNRYHYGVDVIAGWVLGALVLYAGARLGDQVSDQLYRCRNQSSY